MTTKYTMQSAINQTVKEVFNFISTNDFSAVTQTQYAQAMNGLATDKLPAPVEAGADAETLFKSFKKAAKAFDTNKALFEADGYINEGNMRAYATARQKHKDIAVKKSFEALTFAKALLPKLA